jgi:serine/threonine protein kinase
MPIAPDTTILGKYKILRPIGEGGMGRVWLAEEITFGGRQVALKEPRQDISAVDRDDIQRRYQQEIQVYAALQKAHAAHIVPVYTVEPFDGSALLVMDYMAGGDLAQRIAAHPNGLPVDQALTITRTILTALKSAHEHPLEIVHRDVKPANVLFDQGGAAWLADFGLAQISGASGRSHLNGGSHPGSPLYMAPEQATSADYLQPAADIFALGCLLFEMLTGKRYKRVRPGTRLASLLGEMPAWLDEAASKCLAEDPWERYADAGEMLAALSSPPVEAENKTPSSGTAMLPILASNTRFSDSGFSQSISETVEQDSHSFTEVGSADSSKLRSVTIPVRHEYGDRHETVNETFWVAGSIKVVQAHSKEKTWQSTIRASTGKQKQVLIDLYRQLVLGNFASVEGKRGNAAAPILDHLYPDQNTLPRFVRLAKSNTTGMIVYNLMRHNPEKEEGYRLLGGILVSLVDTGFLDMPVLHEKP